MNLDEALKTPDGNNFADGATMRSAIVNALVLPHPGDGQLTGQEKYELFALAMKVNDAPAETEFGVDDIGKIKDRVGKVLSTAAVGRIWQALDPVGTKAAA